MFPLSRTRFRMFIIIMISIAVLVIPGFFAIKLSNFTPFLPFGWKGVFAALPTIFFAYAGFESLAQTAGETKDARETLPRVFLVGVILGLIIYVLISTVAFGVVKYDVLAKSQSAMADVAGHYLPFGAAAIVAVGALMAFTTSLNAGLIVPSRILYILASDRVVPKFLSHINRRFGTPDVAITITAIITILLLWTKTLGYMLNVALQAMFLIYMVHSFTMILLPFVRPRLFAKALVRPPIWLMILAGLVSILTLLWFTWGMLKSVIGLLLIWAAVGTILFLVAKWQGKNEGFDYKYRLIEEWMDKDES